MALLLTLHAAPSYGNIVPLEGVRCNCQQTAPLRLDCDVRSHSGEKLTKVSAAIEGKSLPTPLSTPYPDSQSTTAILLLVDISSSQEQTELLRSYTAQIRQLAALAKPHQQFGLQTFTGHSRITVPISGTPDSVAQAAAKLEKIHTPVAQGQDLQLAVENLAGALAQRKAVVFLTSGGLSPSSYYSADTVDAAQAAGISIYTVLNTSPTLLAPELTALESLSRDTDGRSFRVAANERNTTPAIAKVAEQVITDLDAGQRITIDLTHVDQTVMDGNQVEVNLSFPTRSLSFMVPIGPATSSTSVTQSNLPRSEHVAAKRHRQGETFSPWNTLASLLFISGCGLGLVRYRKGRVTPVVASAPLVNVVATAGVVAPRHAFLITSTDSIRHVIKKTPWRIGRAEDNDLVVDHDSVSRNHAEIIRGADETYLIRDLNSLNGVFINAEKIKLAALSEGYEVAVGDVQFRFSFKVTDLNLVAVAS